MLDLHTLQIIWWGIIALLLIGFALTDGFDIGAAILLPFLGRTDQERRIIINSLGPHWEGNQVWLVTAGAALFAAWPPVYATAFSGLYWAMLLVLFALFLRPVGFDYRSKLDNPRWRQSWDWALFSGSLLPALLFGVAFANLFYGIPFRLDEFLRPSFAGSFWQLLHPFALIVGLLSLSMLVLHGAAWLVLRTTGELAQRALGYRRWAAVATLACYLLAGGWLLSQINGMSLIGEATAGNPTLKQVNLLNPGWQANYHAHPLSYGLILLAGLGLLLASGKGRWLGFLGSSLSIIGIMLSAGWALFPFVLPSNLVISHSLTLFDASSSSKTLGFMLIAAAIFVPLILAYSLWCYKRMWGKLDQAHIEAHSHSLY
ncbi:cytochrome d ubiquinol oxidase subunit II [Balneatrix alpica]|uniref:Cytochrome d ubiquinol oxidase subunit II n=1 Tax=Balneatrix alpica TaxID=75684 RepID=A0ABV5Z8S2_9GAMM|nr:cytochrome d ubiquinol oxidase subunit II [Balneatrix alpica]